jgi:LacI family transcriptional regulator
MTRFSDSVPSGSQHETSQTAPDGGPGSVDLRALSQHLGLSKGTISRALNGYPEIAERTRARVLQAAAALGYKPNRAARRLATGRNDLISYIGVGADWMTVDRSFLSALSATLAVEGYGLMVSLADTMDHASQAMQQLIEDKRVDGFIFNAAFPSDARVQMATARSVPAVIVGTMSQDGRPQQGALNKVPVVGIHDSAVLDGLVDYLHSLGHQRFAYFGCDAPEVTQLRHSRTLAASCQNRGTAFVRDIRPTEIAGSLDRLSLLEPESAALLSARANAVLDGAGTGQPTAVFCGCERTVVALYLAARERGLSIPRELSIIGIGSSQLASWLDGGLSTVSWSLGEAGRLAAECVLALINGREAIAFEARVEAQFVARASHGPAPAPNARPGA